MEHSSVKLRIPSVEFGSEEALVERLLAEESSSQRLVTGPRFLYRGQSREYRRRWPLREGPFGPLLADDLVDLGFWELDPPTLRPPIPLVPYTMDLPALIPTDFRAYEQHLSGGGAAEPQAEDAFDEMVTYFWGRVCAFIVGLAVSLKGDAGASMWYRTQWEADTPRLYKLRSVGQHYGMETGLLDASSSLAVALWFASHEFQSGTYKTGNQGVIYRIDQTRLEEAERWIRQLPGHESFDACSVDIRDTPESVAPRAVRQQGWSLVGWEHPRLLIKMVACGGLTQHVFRTGAAPSAFNDLSRGSLVPADDVMAQLFGRFWDKPRVSLEEAQTWIDRHWNVAVEERIRIDAEGNWLDRLAAEMERISAFHRAQFVAQVPPPR